MLYEFKLVILGNLSVGKTSLVKRFVTHAFKESYKPTLGTEIYLKELIINDEKIIFQLWDLAGAPNFANIRLSFYQKADGGFLVNDVTRPETLQSLDQWMEEVEKAIKYVPEYLILGNKADLVENRLTSKDQLNEFGQKRNIDVLETSAKNGDNVDFAFNKMAKMLIEKEKAEELST